MSIIVSALLHVTSEKNSPTQYLLIECKTRWRRRERKFTNRRLDR
jgi:hypothetical protein